MAYAVAVALLIVGVIAADVLWLPQIAGSLAERMRGRAGRTTLAGPRSGAISAPEVDRPTPAAYVGPADVALAQPAEGPLSVATPSPVPPEFSPSELLGGEAPPIPAGARSVSGAGLVLPRPPIVAPSLASYPPGGANPPPGFAMGVTLTRQQNGQSQGKIVELDPARKIRQVDILRWQGEGWLGVEAIPPEFIE